MTTKEWHGIKSSQHLCFSFSGQGEVMTNSGGRAQTKMLRGSCFNRGEGKWYLQRNYGFLSKSAEKRRKPLMFSVGIERDYWHEMGG